MSNRGIGMHETEGNNANPSPSVEQIVEGAIAQIWPGLSVSECTQWLGWVVTQPNYYMTTLRQATCVSKVYTQSDPPWLRVAYEVAWWGRGRDAVSVLHRSMDWARLQGAVMYGYSLAPKVDTVKWRALT